MSRGKPAAKKVEAPALKGEVRKDITGLLMLFLAIFFTATQLYGDLTGFVGQWLYLSVLTPLIGRAVVVFPAVLGFTGILLLLRRNYLRAHWRITGLILAFLMLALGFEIYASGKIEEFVLPANLTVGGGLLGYLLSFSLQKTIGSIGTYFTLIFVSLIAVLLILNLSLRNIRDGVVYLLQQFRNQEFLPTLNQESPPPLSQQPVQRPLHRSPMPAGGVGPVDQNILEYIREDDGLAMPKPSLLRRMTAKVETEVVKPVSNIFATAPTPMRESKLASPLFASNTPIKTAVAEEENLNYIKPPFTLLKKSKTNVALHNRLKEQAEQDIQILESTLANFRIDARVVNLSHGPSITRYELQPGPGVRVSKIAALSDDLALSLAATGVRIEAPIPGKSVVGIEVPNTETQMVSMLELVENQEFMNHPSKLYCALGKDISGAPIYCDITQMPHMLIAGATGSGKSVCLNTLICSILLRATPSEVKFLMIDPKRVELTPYNHIPHLLAPVVNEPRLASTALKKWAVTEMERRYDLLSKVKVRNLEAFNQKVSTLKQKGYDTWQDANLLTEIETPVPLQPEPFIVIVIDELADLMMIAAGDVENSVCRIAQMARAVGIHLILATQRPSVDVITGLIKANVPSRIAFAVSSQIDARTILDTQGAEKLLGKGDMLYSPIGSRKAHRVQGVYLSDEEIGKIVRHVKSQAKPNYQIDMDQLSLEDEQEEAADGKVGADGRDPYFKQASDIISTTGRYSISYLQRKLRIGYNRAARLHEELSEAGLIPQDQAA